MKTRNVCKLLQETGIAVAKSGGTRLNRIWGQGEWLIWAIARSHDGAGRL